MKPLTIILISTCSYLVQRECKERHNVIASLIHRTLLKQTGYRVQSPWWRHSPSAVWENDEYLSIVWHYTIVTDIGIHHNRPDITFV